MRQALTFQGAIRVETSIVWLIAILASTCGLVIGAGLALWLTPAQKKSRDLESHLTETRSELKDYKKEVAEHFTTTAQLLENLANGYKDVHNHLATGAQSLCTDGYEQRPILQKIGISTAPQEPKLTVNPPLDYAPKSHPYEKGILNEEYGLEKPEKEQEEMLTPLPVAGTATADTSKQTLSETEKTP
jgi:hypothetical protein